MDPSKRYKLERKLAVGDFAAVFQAVDTELGRPVAIKQIHEQYLEDERQLERYWDEAQLLANLQHPHVMAIYDIDKTRGWLVLELMAGNLHQYTSEAIDLDYLRRVLIHSLRALRFLHKSGIIHGDIKPSNLLTDPKRRVKLGDFGLARRVANEEGSLLKGTTKYIAPEVVSEDFGDVGPASDLYSLGFCAYEFLCGPNFEDLFPGLETFGRDKQMAWMLWHSARDRRLPDISAVLEGVPEDLAHVIQKLCTKDRKQRYSSADEALQDLKQGVESAEALREAEEQAAADEAQKKKQRQLLMYAALGVSLLASVGLVFLPQGNTEPPPPPVVGFVERVDDPERELVVTLRDTGLLNELLVPRRTEILRNGEPATLDQIESGDMITAKMKGDATVSIEAYAAETVEGRILSVDSERGLVEFEITAGPNAGQRFELDAGPTVTVRVNEAARGDDGSPLGLSDLKRDDAATLQFVQPGGSGRPLARSIDATHLVIEQAVVEGVDASAGAIVFRPENASSSRTLPLADDCVIRIAGAAAELTDIQPRDQVTIRYDNRVRRIEVDKRAE